MTLEEFLSEWLDGDDRLLVHTSGSTGWPKPLWVEKRRMLASARMTCDFLGLREGDAALLCLPLDYIAGKMMVVRALERRLRLVSVEPGGHPLCSLRSQGVKELRSQDNSLSIHTPRDICQMGLVAMVPLQVWNSLQTGEERERLMAIRHLIIGGGAVDDALAGELQDFPNAVWSTYGMTETLSHIALRRLNGPERSEWYTPMEGVSVSLSADGCLVVDAPLVCAERLVTNDLAELSGQRFRILGRKDNVVCSGGIKIQMETVERRLRPHLRQPFMITKCADKKLGEAVVMLVEGSDTTTPQTLCRRILSKYEQPRHYLAVDRLPVTATGKPARGQAEQLVRERLQHSSAP